MSSPRLQDVLSALPLPALAVDQTERIIAANAGLITLIGQDVVGRSYITMLRQPALLDLIDQSLRDGVPRAARYIANDGVQEVEYDVTARAVGQNANVGTRMLILCFADISHLQEGDQMRRDFVANVSHELRTPLTSLMGFIETLKGPAREDPETSARFLGIMQAEAERMNRLVGDLMSLSRVESNERVRPTTRIDLIAILDSVARTLGPLAAEADVRIEKNFEDETIELLGDQDQLMQVFTNIVENAIKYGGSGERVLLSVQRSDREASLRAPGVRVQVKDYGPGIDPMHLPRITERFYRADDHRSRAMGGTGLGLAIVKHIINRHRGRLRVASELGQGAEFTVILPTSAREDSGPE